MDEKKRQEYFKIVDQNIKDFGFHVTYVLEEKNFTPFGYSTGLYKNFGIPEAFVSGLPNGLTNTLINNYAEKFKHSEIVFEEKLNNLIDRFPVYILPLNTADLEEKALSSFRFYGSSRFKSIQIIFPDLTGNFPEDNGYDYDQEILGKIHL